MSETTIRAAKTADLVAVAAIYAHSVHSDVATFDVEEPPLSYWQAKLDSAAVGDHFLVACSRDSQRRSQRDSDIDSESDLVVGFAYSGAFRPRPAYGRTRETSVYVAQDALGAGLGKLLYGALLELLRRDEVHLVVAVVAQPNPASNALHCKLGFAKVGTLDEVGFKFGAYVSTTWFQLRLT